MVSTEKVVPYKSGHKNECTQKVMVVCSVYMRFHVDMAWIRRLGLWLSHITKATKRPNTNFPHLSQSNRSLMHGYHNTRRYLASYRGCRYHLQDWRSKSKVRGHKEIFNHAYSSLRNIMERCVGILKARFPILKSMALYTLQTQLLIVVATVTVHNYIRQKTERDWLF